MILLQKLFIWIVPVSIAFGFQQVGAFQVQRFPVQHSRRSPGKRFATIDQDKFSSGTEENVPCTMESFEPRRGMPNEMRCGVDVRRRNILALGVALAPLLVFSNPPVAVARDELFKSNPLTNPLLEQIRILDQAQADNLKYGGELEAGDAGNKGKVDAYPKLLVPILEMDQELSQVQSLLNQASTKENTEAQDKSFSEALSILQQSKYDKIPFKKVFNSYGDNIYYSDPDRANLYLGGGAAPKTEQSLAYLLRNDILTNIEALRAELEYRIKSGDREEMEDLYQYASTATSTMKKYLEFVPPTQIETAKKFLSSSN